MLRSPVILTIAALSAGILTNPSTAHAQNGRCFDVSFRNRVQHGLTGFAEVINIPGISFGIVRGESLIYAGGVGYADRSTKRPATIDTPYYIASLTKVFTASLAMIYANRGALDLDAPVSNYLPYSVRVPSDSLGNAITVRALLSHLSGLPRDPPNRRNQKLEGPLDPGIWEPYNITDLYTGLARTPLRSNVGQKYNYSNYGYALLGHIVERVAHQPYEQALKDQLLSPLGMRSTSITLTATQQKNLAAFYWTEDLTRTEQRARARYGEVAGFIGLTSTVRDLAPFVAAHLNTLSRVRNPMSTTVIAQMQQPAFVIGTDATSRNEMGLGWRLVTAANLMGAPTIVTHTGNVDGHSSGLFLNPAEKIGVILLENIGGGDGDMAIDYLGFWLIELASREQKHCGA